jgi:electron transport complex protein RnfB
MGTALIYPVVTLSLIGAVAAIVLYVVARKCKVDEDTRVGQVEEVLPGANCGGCGYAGCRAFSEVCVRAGDLSGLFCPVGGNDCMEAIANLLGLESVEKTPKIAVIRCNGTYNYCLKTNSYNGVKSCAILSLAYSGETGCAYGCLGHGDCVNACNFDALFIDSQTGLPKIVEDKCVACGACVAACPKHLIELRKKSAKNRKIYVSCRNKDKGALAAKACAVACIGCQKCVKVCPFGAVTVQNNLAFIDSDKCKLCRKCVAVCPTNAIMEENFPSQNIKAEATTSSKPVIQN